MNVWQQKQLHRTHNIITHTYRTHKHTLKQNATRHIYVHIYYTRTTLPPLRPHTCRVGPLNLCVIKCIMQCNTISQRVRILSQNSHNFSICVCSTSFITILLSLLNSFMYMMHVAYIYAYITLKIYMQVYIEAKQQKTQFTVVLYIVQQAQCVRGGPNKSIHEIV